MRRQIIGYFFAIVVAVNCLLVSAVRRYELGDINDLISKRRFQRRNFLKGFCSSRCNVGRGGPLCRCNGFHFAGKRTSNQPLDSVASDDSDNAIYDILARNLKISLGNSDYPDEENNGASAGLMADWSTPDTDWSTSDTDWASPRQQIPDKRTR